MGCKSKRIIKNSLSKKFLFFLIICILFVGVSVVTKLTENADAEGNTCLDEFNNIYKDCFDNLVCIDDDFSSNTTRKDGKIMMIDTFPFWTEPRTQWPYLKQIDVESSGTQSYDDIAINLKIDNVTGKMEDDYHDLRFITEYPSGTYNNLDYWIESYNENYANVWLRIPKLYTENNIIYSLYGKDVTEYEEDFDNVFPYSNDWTNKYEDDIPITTHENERKGMWRPNVCLGQGDTDEDYFLVVWEEGKKDIIEGHKQKIMASVYDEDGNFKYKELIFKDDCAPYYCYYKNNFPSVAFGAGIWFIVWEHFDPHYNIFHNTFEGLKTRDIYACVAKIENGNLEIDEIDPVVDDYEITQHTPDIVFNSEENEFLVVWTDFRDSTAGEGGNIYGSLYNSDGTPIDGKTEKPLTSFDDYDEFMPSVAFDPVNNQYMIVYEKRETNPNAYASIKGQLFDENLNEIDEEIDINDGQSSGEHKNPCVEFCKETERFLITWDKRTSDGWQGIWGEIRDADGNFPGPSEIYSDFEIISGDDYHWSDIVPYFKSSFLVSYTEGNSDDYSYIRGKIVNSTNAEVQTNTIPISADSDAEAFRGSMDGVNGRVFTAWQDKRGHCIYPLYEDEPDIFGNIGYFYDEGLYETDDTSSSEKTQVLEANVTSDIIAPEDLENWNYFACTGTKDIIGDIDINILDADGNFLQHFEEISGIKSLNTQEEEIRLRANFTRPYPSISPYLDSWSVSYESSDGNTLDDYICYWKFDEESGNIAYDSAGDNDGIIYGAARTTETPSGSGFALDFDGEDDYVNITDDDSLSFGNGVDDYPFTFTAWIKRDETGVCHKIFTKYNTTGYPDTKRQEYIFKVEDDDKLTIVLFDLANDNNNNDNRISIQTEASIDTNMHFVATTYDGSESVDGLKLYIDGVQQDTTILNDDPDYQAMHNTIESAKIGVAITDNGYVGNFDGIIDEVRIYNRVLGDDEIEILASGDSQQNELLAKIEYDDERQCYKGGDEVTIFVNITQGTLYTSSLGIKIHDETDKVLVDDPLNSYDNNLNWYYPWIVNYSNKATDGEITVSIIKEVNLQKTSITLIDDYPKIIDNTDPIINGPEEIIEPGSTTIFWSAYDVYDIDYSVLQWGKDSQYNEEPEEFGQIGIKKFTELEKNSTYHYKVTAFDIAGNSKETIDLTFNTGDLTSTKRSEGENPIADAGGPYLGFVGEPITFDASDSLLSRNGTFLWYNWDLDGDGEFDTVSLPEVSTTKTFYKIQEHNVTLMIEEYPSQKTDTYTTSVIIIENNTIELENLTKDNTSHVEITGATDIIVVYIEITPTRDLSNVSINTIDFGTAKPRKILKEPNIEDLKEEISNKTIENIKIYRYVDIDLTTNAINTYDSDVKSAEILFKVDQEWIENNNIDKESISLLRYHNNRWQKLNTTHIGSPSEIPNSFFLSKTPGFSTFAVVGSKVVEKGETLDKPEEEPIPWIIIFGFIISAIVVLIFILFKTKLIYIEDAETVEKE